MAYFLTWKRNWGKLINQELLISLKFICLFIRKTDSESDEDYEYGSFSNSSNFTNRNLPSSQGTHCS